MGNMLLASILFFLSRLFAYGDALLTLRHDNVQGFYAFWFFNSFLLLSCEGLMKNLIKLFSFHKMAYKILNKVRNISFLLRIRKKGNFWIYCRFVYFVEKFFIDFDWCAPVLKHRINIEFIIWVCKHLTSLYSLLYACMNACFIIASRVRLMR